MRSPLKYLETETVEFSSNLTAEELLANMKNFRKSNSKFSIDLVLGNRPNLYVFAKSNYKVQISPLWQLTQLPGIGMNVTLKGTIVPVGGGSRIEAFIKPHVLYVAVFWTSIMASLSTIAVTLLDHSFATKYNAVRLLSFFLAGAWMLLFCSYNKKKLIKDITKTFGLTITTSLKGRQ